MDIRETKKFLRRYESNQIRVEHMQNELDEKRERLDNISSSRLTGMPREGIPVTKEDLIADIDILERRLAKIIAKGRILKEELLFVIDDVGDPKLCRVLELYYIDFLTLEKIAEKMNYSYRHIQTLYQQALNSIIPPNKVTSGLSITNQTADA